MLPRRNARGVSVNRMVDTVKVSVITSQGRRQRFNQTVDFRLCATLSLSSSAASGYDVHTLDELKTRWQICGTRDRRVLIEVSLAPEVILSPCH